MQLLLVGKCQPRHLSIGEELAHLGWSAAQLAKLTRRRGETWLGHFSVNGKKVRLDASLGRITS